MIRILLQAGVAAAMIAAPIASTVSAQEITGNGYARQQQQYNPGYGGGYQYGMPLDPGYYARPGVVYEGRSASNGRDRYCIKLCEQDTNPCDPIYYKRADRRCSQNGDF